MKKTICLLLILLLALVPILVSATNNDDVETITLIKYDFDTGIQSEIVIEVDETAEPELSLRWPGSKVHNLPHCFQPCPASQD